jgi:hypothetical protein
VLATACTVVVSPTPAQIFTPPSTSSADRVLDELQLQYGVQQVLANNYEIDATDVSCPPDELAEPGNRFTCTAMVAGDLREVTITVKNTDGLYEVGQPH